MLTSVAAWRIALEASVGPRLILGCREVTRRRIGTTVELVRICSTHAGRPTGRRGWLMWSASAATP